MLDCSSNKLSFCNSKVLTAKFGDSCYFLPALRVQLQLLVLVGEFMIWGSQLVHLWPTIQLRDIHF